MLTNSLLCLALVIHNESRGEPKEGKMAIAHVTLNRSKNKNNICKTVYAKGQFATQPVKFTNNPAWTDSKIIARDALFKKTKDPTNGAVYFHNNKVNPKWKFKKTKKIGNHIFYK